MSETASTMIPLLTQAPDFCLLEPLSGKMRGLEELKSPIATVIMFICNHCPYVKLIQSKLVEISTHYQKKGVHFVAINSNDIEMYPQDGPEFMRTEAVKHAYPFPYLFDATQAIAKAYQAACTPDFYLFDASLLCVYRGRFDAATPGNGKLVTGEELCWHLDNLLLGKPLDKNQLASVGCNIKWKKNN